MTAKPHIETVTPAMENRFRMMKIRSEFKKIGIINPVNKFIEAFPKYNTASEGMAVRTVWNGNSGRQDIIDRFEKLLERIQKEEANG